MTVEGIAISGIKKLIPTIETPVPVGVNLFGSSDLLLNSKKIFYLDAKIPHEVTYGDKIISPVTVVEFFSKLFFFGLGTLFFLVKTMK